MAESVVSFVVDKLGNLLVQELILLGDVRDKVERLQRELERVQCFLRDADTKRKTDERVRHWVKEIRNVAHEAEDVIDTFIINADRHRRSPGVSGFLKRYLRATTDVVGRRRASKAITAIMDKISEISASRITYGIRNLEAENGGGVGRLVPVRRSTFPHDEDSDDVVAFDRPMSELVEQLLHHSEKRSVMSIVGIGGLGKTTLARKVYNSVEVKREFGIRAWITVSQDYGSVELLNEILKQVRKCKEKLEQREVIEKLRDSLKAKRYLIVMDDVWSQDVWEQMQVAFPDEKNGSRVLITTRYLNVAKYGNPTVTPYELRLLTDEEGLELLWKKASADQDHVQENCPEDLRSLGLKLVKFCGNLPLALVVVGGLLSIREKEHSTWERFLKTTSWQFEGKKCMEILALSYEDLPHYLKSCFLYLAAFPEDTEIQATKLIRLWIAEGFVPHQGRGTIEETAEDCLEELTQRCMVQVVSRKYNCRSIKSCRVHDLLREFAVQEAKEDRFLIIYNKPNQDTASPPGPGRRAAFHNLDGLKGLTIPNLRSLLSFNMGQANFSDSGAQFKLLRVIDLSGVQRIKSLPEAIKVMIHLRYLGLRWTGLEVIPSSIGHLQNLETLDVRYNFSLKKLPPTLWNIKKLRHVLVFDTEGPPPSANLPSLQTLVDVHVPVSWGRGLPNITSVRKLGLTFSFQDCDKILSSLLEKLDHLLSLSVWAFQDMVSQPKCYAIPSCASNCLNDDNEAKNVEPVMAILSGIDTRAFPCHRHIQSMCLAGRWYTTTVGSHEFPPYLVKLSLIESRLEHDPMPTLEKLQNLRVLLLSSKAFLGKKMICSAAGFPQLQNLVLLDLDQLEEWCLEADAMQKITYVRIDLCKALKVVPEFQRLPNLQELNLWGLPREFIDKISVDGEEDHYKIQNVQSVSTDHKDALINI